MGAMGIPGNAPSRPGARDRAAGVFQVAVSGRRS